MEDLLHHMGERQWRVREASCTAMAEALTGAEEGQILKYIDRLHYMIFRALDDIKETVSCAMFSAACLSFLLRGNC